MKQPSAHRHTFTKRIEIGIRSAFNRLIGASGTPVRVTQPMNVVQGDRPKILFLRQDRIGDVLVASPIIKAVRERYPEATIDVLLSTNNISVQRSIAPFINSVLLYERSAGSLLSLTRRIRQTRYDVVVDLLDNASSTSGIVLARSNARCRVGIDKENAGAYTHVVPLLDRETHPIAERVAQLLMPFGIDPATADMRPVYEVTTEEQDLALHDLGSTAGAPRLGVILSGSMEYKRYGPERTIAVLKRIMPRYPQVQVVLFGLPSESADLERIAGETGALVAPPSTSFHHYATRLRVMDALWCPDTAAVHLAAAWNMPVCAMYVPDTEGRHPWLPYQTWCEAIMSPGDSLKAIPVDRAVEGIDRLFAYCGFESIA